MNERLKIALAVILILAGVFYKPGMFDNIVNNKLTTPEAEIVILVKGLKEAVANKGDAAKLAGYFEAMSLDFGSIPNINNNLQMQYLLDFTGKRVFNTSLMENGKPKHPDFAPTLSRSISKVIGPQGEKEPLTPEEKANVAKLFHGVAWSLYNKELDKTFEDYKKRTERAILEYSVNNGPAPKPPDDAAKCNCSGNGDIVHGDGHKTPCICSSGDHKCSHNSSCRFADVTPPPTPDSGCPCESDVTMCVCETHYGVCDCESGKSGKSGKSAPCPTRPTQPARPRGIRGIFEEILR